MILFTRRNMIFLVLAIILLAILFFIVIQVSGDNKTIIFKNKNSAIKINALIADELKEQTTGLQHRETLATDKGMLFIYPDEKPREFWMKDTLIPLDIIFLNHEKQIIKIHQNAQPCQETVCQKFPSLNPAMYVIEVNAGFVDKYNISTMTEIIF